MKPGCYDCRKGNCYHIDINNLYARIEMLEDALALAEERLNDLMAEQYLEPWIHDYDLSDEDIEKLKKWIASENN